MTRKIILFLSIFILLLAACKPASSTQVSEVPAPTQMSASEVQVTKATQVTTASQPGCTVTSRTADAEPTGDSLIPPVAEQDWIKGPADAYVTIIEYGDFQ